MIFRACLCVRRFFFFKQKTAYEISACLVGSEMCIRDRPEIRQEPGGQTDVAPTLLGLLNMSYTQNDFGINLLTEQRPYVYFSADNLIAATDTTHLYIYSPHDRQEFKYKKQGNALQLVTGEDSTFYVMKKYCFSTLQSAEYLVKEHKTVNKATGQ